MLLECKNNDKNAGAAVVLPGYGELREMAVNDLGSILKRIDRRLEEVKLTDRAASLAAGMSADAIRTMRRQWENYKKDLPGPKQKTATAHTLVKLARPLQTTSEWLMSEIGPEEASDASRARTAVREIKNNHRIETRRARGAAQLAPIGLKVAGEIVAGTWREAVCNQTADLGDTEVPAAPGYPANQQFVVVVRGQSINRVAQYGDYLVVLDVASSAIMPHHGDLVVVARTKGDLVETTAKRYCISSDKDAVELRYDSTDPQFSNSVMAKLPLKASGVGTKADDGTEIAIKGIVLGIWRAPS